jgi:hypothetical protein
MMAPLPPSGPSPVEKNGRRLNVSAFSRPLWWEKVADRPDEGALTATLTHLPTPIPHPPYKVEGVTEIYARGAAQ